MSIGYPDFGDRKKLTNLEISRSVFKIVVPYWSALSDSAYCYFTRRNFCPLVIKGRISPFLFLKDKLFELYGIFTVAFIKYKKILAHYWMWKRFFLQEGSTPVLLYQIIAVYVWRFCYIKRRVGFFSCYHLCG